MLIFKNLFQSSDSSVCFSIFFNDVHVMTTSSSTTIEDLFDFDFMPIFYWRILDRDTIEIRLSLEDAIHAGGINAQDATWIAQWVPELFENLSPREIKYFVENYMQVISNKRFNQILAMYDYEEENLPFFYWDDKGLNGVLILDKERI